MTPAMRNRDPVQIITRSSAATIAIATATPSPNNSTTTSTTTSTTARAATTRTLRLSSSSVDTITMSPGSTGSLRQNENIDNHNTKPPPPPPPSMPSASEDYPIQKPKPKPKPTDRPNHHRRLRHHSSSSSSSSSSLSSSSCAPEDAHDELSRMLERSTLHNAAATNTGNAPNTTAANANANAYREPFPMACRSLLHGLEGNHNCIDCNARDPEWAAISYGALVCIRCSGKHRSLGVAVSQVRSVSMDHWTHKEVVAMLEGGNAQLRGFFARHALTRDEFLAAKRSQSQPQQPGSPRRKKAVLTAENLATLRYKTKAALFYKSQLEAHVDKLLEDPQKRPYTGRSRRPSARKTP